MIGFTPKGVLKEVLDDIKKPTPKEKVQKKKFPAKLKSSIITRFNDDFDTIYEAYTNPKKKDKLSLTQKKQLARWKFARQWFSEFQPANDIEVVNALREEYGISQRQAYIDVANCKRLFASIEQVNEEFDRIMFIEGIKRLRSKAINYGDPKGYEVAARCDATMVKVKGYDRDKQQMPQPITVVTEITADLTVLGLEPIANLPVYIKSFWKKKEEEKMAEIENIDYEDILDNPRNEREHTRQ